MQPMSMVWQWSSRACGISGIDLGVKPIILLQLLLLSLLASLLISSASATIIQSGPDIQAAIANANPGDTIIVGAGEHNIFEVDKPLKVLAAGAEIRAGIQKPAITISSDSVSVSGFRIVGVGKDTTSKFDYYMQNPGAAAGQRLDLPNAAILVNGNDVVIDNTTIFGAEAGIFTDSALNISLLNDTFESCDSGVILKSCDPGKIVSCVFSKCNKAGMDIEGCSEFVISNNSVKDTTNVGLLLKESDECNVTDNLFSGNIEGLALWNSTFIDVLRNSADHNYYGILLSGSDNNTIMDNNANDNSRSEIVKGFGVGISLQGNSSCNVIARNTARRDFNGFEAIKGCKLNVIYGNNATDNTHGLRMDKNYNNLIFGNNFARNTINAYENLSRNTWNTSVGNYYSDYKGKDVNGDGIGDQPYKLPGTTNTKSVDLKPLIRPYAARKLSVNELRSEPVIYARYSSLVNEDETPYKIVSGAIVIQAKEPTGPPTFPESKPIFD